MKKITIRMLALVLAICCVLALGACGGSDNSKADSSVVDDPNSTPVSSAVTGGTPNADGKYTTVEDMVNSDAMQSQMESMKEQFGDIGAALDITGEGNKLIYTFTYDDLGDQDAESISDLLEATMEQMASVFEGIATGLSEQVVAGDVSVVVTYKTSDGVELFSQEYFAN